MTTETTSEATAEKQVTSSHKVAGRVGFGLLVLLAALIGTVSGFLLVYATDLPQLSELEHYRPNTITELYDDQDKVIGSFALQRRVIVSYEDFSPGPRDRGIPDEEKDFQKHWGVNGW